MSAPAHQGPPSLGHAIALLLGRQASAGGPFALLGLTPDDCTQDLVIVQLQRQLARIAAHPMGTSPAADAVRAALHAAAAELLEVLDAQAPNEPSAHVSSLTPVRPGPSALPPSPLTTPATAPSHAATPAPALRTVPATITPELASSARDILAEFGGWNARSRQRLTFLAYSAGVRVNELLAAAQSATSAPPPPTDHSPPSAAAAVPPRNVGVTPDAGLYINDDGTPRNEPFADEIDPTHRFLKWIVLAILGGLATILILAGVAYIMLRPANTPAPPAPIAQGPSPTAPTPPGPSSELFPAPKAAVADKPVPTKPPPPTHPRDFADDLRDLARCVTTATTDPEDALRSFDTVTKSISSTWTSAQPDQLAAMQDTIVEFVYRVAPSPEHAALAIDLIARGLPGPPPDAALTGDRIRAAAWSVGTLARVARERELPSALALRLQSALATSPLATWRGNDSTFQSGATAALAVLARSLTPTSTAPAALAPENDAWPAWVAGLDALHLDPRDRDRMVLVAIEELLTVAPEPTQSKPTFDALSLLITSLTWRDTDESRRWLLRWFDLSTVSVADLHALTSSLASRSSAAGFDVSMVLAAGANEQDRATLRDRLRQAWGLADGPARAKLVSAWRESAEQELGAAPAASMPGEHALVEFYRAVVWSRLSETAGMILANEPGAASIDLVLDASVKSAIDSLGSSASTPPMFNDEPTWIVRYLGAGSNIAGKKQALSELNSSLPLPRAVGEVVVAEAIRGSNSEIRRQAADIVRQHASDPAVVHGWLVQLPTMPAFQEYSDLLAAAALTRLPPVRSPGWRVSARRALVERLLQLIADSGSLTGIDNASTLLAQSYAHRLATCSWNSRPDAPPPGEATDSTPPDALLSLAPVESSARLYRLRLEREAREKAPTGREPLSLAQIASRHEGRSKVASGRIQAFAAEQAGAFELLAYIVASERPDVSSQVAAILDDVTILRRKASQISTQIEGVERATLRLWLLRLEGGKA